MKLYEKLKTHTEAIQQQMVEAKKNERADAPKEVNLLCKGFSCNVGLG
jgi:hypothetical protein